MRIGTAIRAAKNRNRETFVVSDRAKKCTRCGSDTNGYYKDKRATDGQKSECKKCFGEIAAAWKKAHPERAKQIAQKSVKKNREKYRGRVARYQRENREQIRRVHIAWVERNPEKIDSYEARLKQARKEWKKANPLAMLAYSQKRRAMKKQAEGVFSPADVGRMLVEQGGSCAACRVDLSASGYHVDHIRALAKGGSNWPENLQLLCPRCNTTKATMDMDAFIERLSRKVRVA